MLKNQKGFSLIELMVVVAIIGILSAVAVPQFQKFQRKAKQSEIKSSLAGIYIAEKAFLAEHNTYYGSLYTLGVYPEGSMIYDFGIVSSGITRPPGIPNINGYQPNHFNLVSHICGTTYAYSHSFDTAQNGRNCKNAQVVPYASLPSGSVATASAFQVGAYGDLGGSVPDLWTMNQRKELVNTQNGAL